MDDIRAGERSRQEKVAIVGTGLAGLTTAYLLHNDPQKRFAVTLLDQSQSLSFAAASVAVKNTSTGLVEQIDLPMRASAGGYYHNLMRMYKYLEIPLHPIRFLFAFSKAITASAAPILPAALDAGSMPGSYFVHASNLHQLFPPRPVNRGLVTHFFEILYLIICHFWFSVACLLVAPYDGSSKSSNKSHPQCETVGEYLQRIWLPRRYVSHYLMPLMSCVSTCSHAEMAAFPASDVVNYKKQSTGKHHYAVCGGAHQVQDRLVQGIKDIRLDNRVLSVEPINSEVRISFRVGSASGIESEEIFDRVVLAVSPDVAGRIFKPLTKVLSPIPTIQAESSVMSPDPTALTVVPRETAAAGSWGCAHHSGGPARDMPAQVISLRTQFTDAHQGDRSEALHAMPGGAVVSTCPLEEGDVKGTLQRARFTRTLRTTESREIVRVLMGEAISSKREDGCSGWVNGQDCVWLAGAWCWDGMVLLEGCVVSAMRIADAFGVPVPWEKR